MSRSGLKGEQSRTQRIRRAVELIVSAGVLYVRVEKYLNKLVLTNYYIRYNLDFSIQRYITMLVSGTTPRYDNLFPTYLPAGLVCMLRLHTTLVLDHECPDYPNFPLL